MSGISSSIGLISGIDTAKLIDQLIALEARPVQNLEARIKNIDIERTAFAELAARLLALKNSALSFTKPDFFNRFDAKSSNEDALVAVADSTAAPGSSTLRVHSLVSNHATVTRGFADAARSSLGVGTLTVESVRGKINRTTELAELNGGRGVRRGSISITDRSGATAVIDLSKAFTVDDVLEAINSNTQVRVRASVTGLASGAATGERLVIEDESGGTGNLSVSDVAGGFTANDLGLRTSVAAARIDGSGVYRLGMGTPLASLNDGNGVDRLPQGALVNDLEFSTSLGNFGVSLTDVMGLTTDLRALNEGNGVRLGVIRVSDRAGNSAEIDLTAAKTILDVRDAFNNSGLNVSATTVNSFFFVTDTTEVSPNTPAEERKKLKIEDVSGFAAADLGIAQEVENDSIRGRDVYRMNTLGDLVRAINFASGNASSVEAGISADGLGITLRALGDANSVTVAAGTSTDGAASQAAADLGILGATFDSAQSFTSRRLTGGLNTTLLRTLNGGSGVLPGVVSFTDRAGNTASIDFSTSSTLNDVIELINADATLQLRASANSAGNGLAISDESLGTGAISIADVTGTMAAELGIAGNLELESGDSINGGNLERRYISRATKLSELNNGAGVRLGAIQIKNSAGAVSIVNFSASLKTIGHVVDAINIAAGVNARAAINDTGDGIIITDESGGTQTLEITERDGGATAKDLNLLGSAKAGENLIDGSFETRIDISASDSLSALASKLNAAQAGFNANVVNDGSSINPFSMAITSDVSGRRGELIVDAMGLDLGLSTLTQAQDAIVSLGPQGNSSMLISSSTNKLENAINGVTLDLLAPSDEPITVTTTQDIDSVVETMRSFVESYNEVQEAIDKNTRFDPETLDRGVLLGDSTISTVRNRLNRLMSQPFDTGSSELSRMFAVGLRLGSGNRLELNEDKFREIYEKSPREVENLFNTLKTGFGAVFDETIEDLTGDVDGLVSRKDKLLIDQQEVLKDRIESLNLLLEGKRRRLETQFAGLETTLAALQGQQNSLGALSQLLART